MNLTNNALKYTSPGSVAIECNQHLDGGRAATDISVIDSGVGIKQEDQEQLFNAFARVGDPRKQQEGTGLGLYYSRPRSSRTRADAPDGDGPPRASIRHPGAAPCVAV
jgi:signal transduction histidine kinase